MIDEELEKHLNDIAKTQIEINLKLLEDRDAINAIQTVLATLSPILGQLYEQGRAASAVANQQVREKLVAAKKALGQNDPEQPLGRPN
jgi:hypothetical protein